MNDVFKLVEQLPLEGRKVWLQLPYYTKAERYARRKDERVVPWTHPEAHIVRFRLTLEVEFTARPNGPDLRPLARQQLARLVFRDISRRLVLQGADIESVRHVCPAGKRVADAIDDVLKLCQGETIDML